jgi:hypothetical protein
VGGGERLCQKSLEYIRSCRASIKISYYIPRSSVHAFSPNTIDFFVVEGLGWLDHMHEQKKKTAGYWLARTSWRKHFRYSLFPSKLHTRKRNYSCYITIQRVRGWAERVNTNIWDQSKNNFSEINLVFFFLTDELRFSFIDVTFVANRIIRQNVT